MDFKDATELARLVREEKLAAETLLEQTIERIDSLNGKLNAVITPLYNQARESVDRGLPEGPFTGVPFLLKDLIASFEDAPLSMGSELMEGFEPDHNSFLVDRYQEAGLVILGKTNTPEFGIQPTTEPDRFGPTHNPWDLTVTPGGSSGGSAAAVASGMVPMAHGNDGGGSIRIPAACCGIFGLKPTRGRITLGPDFGDLMGGFVTEHALTRSVRDSARLLDATRGPATGDPYVVPEPERSYASEVGRDPGSLSIGVLTETLSETFLASECREAVEDVADLCGELGHRTEVIAPDLQTDLINEAFLTVWAAGTAASLEGAAMETHRELTPEHVEPLTWALYEMGQEFTSSDYLMAQTFLQRVSRTVQEEYFSDYDLWLTPTLAKPPAELGHFDSTPDEPLKGFERASEFVHFTPIFNVTGQPAMSVPLAWSEDDLPVGVQFAAGYGEEGLLFRLASQLQNARNWVNKLPPINVF